MLTKLISIEALFKDSFQMLKGSILNLFLQSIISFGLVIGLVVAGFITLLPFGLLSFLAAAQTKNFTPVLFSSIGAFIFVISILIIIFTIVNLWIQASSFLFTANYKNKPKFSETLKKGFSYVWKLFLLGIVVGFINAGGYFLFIIPGIFFSLLFIFAPFEIVLNNQGVLNSMRRSAAIVLSQFWGFFGRLLLLSLISTGITFVSIFISVIIQFTHSSSISTVWSLTSTIISIVIAWYGLCYMVTLYKNASLGLENDKGKNILWPFITALIGWILGFFFIIMLTAFVATIMLSYVGSKQKADQKNTTLNTQLATQGPYEKLLLDKNNQLFQQMSKSTIKQDVTKINDERIQLLKEGVVKEPKNALFWSLLAVSYSYSNSDPAAITNMIEAAKQAVALDPSSINYSTLGNAYYLKDDNNNAILNLEKSARLNPNDAYVYYRLGLSYEGLGIGDQALENYNKSIELYLKINSDGKYDQTILNIRKGISVIQGNR